MENKRPDGQDCENSPSRRVTLRDIAKVAGVSHVAVSLALRDSPQVGPKNRARIRKIAEEMGYVPDPMLAALSHYRISNQGRPVQASLAWINPLEEPDELRKHIEFDLYWQGAQAAAKKLGYRLEEFRTAELSLQRMESMFKARNVRGIIIAGMLPAVLHDSTVDWSRFSWEGFSTVRFGRKTSYPQAHFVTSAQATNTIMAFSQMTERGYRRIGYVGEYTEARVFCAGFLFAQLGLPAEDRVPPLLFHGEELARPENEAELKEWIEQNQPDAILTDRAYLLQMLKNLDYRIPEDIGIATTSIHDTPINAGIDQNPMEIGRTAVHLLAAEINQHHFGIPKIRNETLIEGKWVDGSMLPNRL